MAFTTHRISAYRVYHCTNENREHTAYISCFRGDVCVGQLRFHKDGVSVPASRRLSNDFLDLHFNEHRLRDIVETFRLEKPIYIQYDDDGCYGCVATTNEPVGEQER